MCWYVYILWSFNPTTILPTDFQNDSRWPFRTHFLHKAVYHKRFIVVNLTWGMIFVCFRTWVADPGVRGSIEPLEYDQRSQKIKEYSLLDRCFKLFPYKNVCSDKFWFINIYSKLTTVSPKPRDLGSWTFLLLGTIILSVRKMFKKFNLYDGQAIL